MLIVRRWCGTISPLLSGGIETMSERGLFFSSVSTSFSSSSFSSALSSLALLMFSLTLESLLAPSIPFV